MVNNIEQTWRQLICFQKARVENDSKMNGFYKHVRSLKILKKKIENQVHVPGLLLCNIICINMVRLRQPYQMRIYSALRNFEFWAKLVRFRAVSSWYEFE